MTLSRRIVLLAALTGAIVSLLATAQAAQAAPTVTVGDKPFPAGVVAGGRSSCSFRIGFAGFVAGQRVNIEFRSVAPTVPREGDAVIRADTFVLDSASRTVTYDLREPLFNRFRPGSLAGWDVELNVAVTNAGTTAFRERGVFLVAGDCIVPPATTTTTSTTVKCAPGSCADQPPAAFLSGLRGETRGEQGSFCWRSGSTGQSLCRDSGFLDPSTALAVTRGEQLRLRFETSEQPLEVVVYPHSQLASPRQPIFGVAGVPLPSANPTTFDVDVQQGPSWLVVATKWNQGSSVSFFKVQGQAPPADATPARLSMTG